MTRDGVGAGIASRRRGRRSLRGLVLAAGLAFLIAACGGEAEPSKAPSGGVAIDLDGTSWAVRSVVGLAPVPGSVPTIRFDGGKVNGSGGCNSLFGRYELDPATGRILVADLGMTLIGCQANIAEMESRFLQALGRSTTAALDDAGRLILRDPAGGEIVLVRAPQPADGG